ncbi:MAG TPA: ATP phosphoribosyltransferase regulatory subunit [Nannocystaceae bacterium]|nr:ATP phosphoribosyltransferase regulatory subunit [Nannocystaceae bacterium]
MADSAPLGLPRGSRELLPAASRRRRALVQGLLGELERWGYEQVETPLVEYFDVVARGLTEADREACVRFIDGATGALVTLRADPTPQIARMLAQRLGGELASDAVQRWCYAADVVRTSGAREPTEGHQVGVELLGDGDAWADVELVALCDAALRACGLVDFRIDLAHAQLARTAIGKLGLERSVRIAVRDLLARKHTVALARLLAEHGVPPEIAARVASLCDRIGDAQVIASARSELGTLVEHAHLDALAGVCEGLGDEIAARLVVDLGEVRGYDYYSGVRVRVWAPGVARPIVRGGRYDRLLAGYGCTRAATGFAIDLDALEQALARVEPRIAARTPAHLVALPNDASATLRAKAARLAARERGAGLRAWVQPASSPVRAEELARDGEAATLTWIEPRAGKLALQRRVHDGARWRTEASWDEDA